MSFPRQILKASESIPLKLNRFHAASRNLSEVGQNNTRILRGWAKSKGWQKAPNCNGGPEKWGMYKNDVFQWKLRIKPEPSFRPGLHEESSFPRFDARLNGGGQHFINPFTGQIGEEAIGTHLPLEHLYH